MDNAAVDPPNTAPQARAGNGPDTVGPPAGRVPPSPRAGAALPTDPLAPPWSASKAASTPARAAAEPGKSEPGAQDSISTPLDDRRPGASEAAATTLPSLFLPPRRARLFGPLAATIAIAAAVGGMAGSIATAGLGAIWPEHAVQAASPDGGPVRDSIARIDAALECSGRPSTNRTSPPMRSSSDWAIASSGSSAGRLSRPQSSPSSPRRSIESSMARARRRATPRARPRQCRRNRRRRSPRILPLRRCSTAGSCAASIMVRPSFRVGSASSRSSRATICRGSAESRPSAARTAAGS